MPLPLVGTSALFVFLFTAVLHADDADLVPERVSYHQQIRPIFQAHCQGCHQPAKPSGQYVMTSFEQMLSGGESGVDAVVAHKPDESYLVDLITPVAGVAEMPREKPPLAASEIGLIRKWIEEGAQDDTPANTREIYSPENPPVYSLPPVVTSLDFSPDGNLLAIAGFHEVLLHKADGTGLVDRLIGMSERIESVKFSPDGKQLAVTGGLPGRMGEVQVWDVAKRRLTLSVPVTSDTIYGANWSPDAKLISFGCADNTLRAVDAKTGEQVLYQGAHNDWVRDTVFSADGSHLISVSRDMSVKLTEVATQRFIDNITSITPGALKGGVNSVARYPESDEVFVGGADGVPSLFRVFRQSKRVIGDNANLLREFPAMRGRIFSVAISRDGTKYAAGSSLNGAGQVRIYTHDLKTEMPKDLLKIAAKRVRDRKPEEQKRVDEFRQAGVKVLAEADINAGIYAVAFSSDGQHLAASGSDGMVRLIDSETGSTVKEFLSAPLASMGDNPNQAAVASTSDSPTDAMSATVAEPTENMPAGAKVVGLEVFPPSIQLTNRFDYVQLLVTARLDGGDAVDATRAAKIAPTATIVDISQRRLVRPVASGAAELVVSLGDLTTKVPVEVADLDAPYKLNYLRDVTPVIGKLGCNAGTCHGSKDGKNGFKLSLRGYDPIFDTRAFTDDLACRRVNFASPDNSLMLLKATGSVPHVGGQLTRMGDPYYEIIRGWIAGGAKLDLETPRVANIDIVPQNPIVQRIGSKQQVRVLATYTDGKVRDVTAEAFVETGNGEVAAIDEVALITTVRRGEAPILARYEGRYAATTLTVMGDRSGFVWQQPPANNFIDELVADKLQRMKILSSDLCTDAEFIRRVHLDLTGLPPSANDVKKFLADKRETKVKRDELIDSLIGNDAFIDHWTNKWADLLQVNRKFLGTSGAKMFRDWIRQEVANNAPYDEFARKVLTATGSNKDNPAASYFKILRTPEDTMENTTQLFLAIRFNCNKCHDHPFERWTQDQYYETAAWFAQIGLKKDPASGKEEIGKTAVESGKPLYEIVYDKDAGEVTHERTGRITPPVFPYEAEFSTAAEDATRREELAAWITSRHNQYFARSYVNRLWGYLLGVGLIEPLDDIRAGNPPTNPELLDRLTQEFIDRGFDMRHMLSTICKSRTYQLSLKTNEWNEDDEINYSHAIARRLPAEAVYDAVHFATGSLSRPPGVPPGTRAAQFPDAGVTLPDEFLAKLGRPARESSCECERSSGMELGPVMALISGPTVSNAISDSNNDLAKLAASDLSDNELVDEVFLRVLNRPATMEEVAAGTELIRQLPEDHKRLVAALKEYEEDLQPILAERERQRQEKIAAANAALATYETEIAPREAELDRRQQERTAKLEAELKEYEATLPEKLAAWEAKQNQAIVWTAQDPIELSATNNAKLEKQDDLSVFASGPNGKGSYKFVARTDLKEITAVKLELFADERLPKKGPGRSPSNGNFVLTEFRLETAPEGTPDQTKAIDFQNAQADFSQDNYDVKTAIDKQEAPTGNGWASSPKLGENRTAVFETKENVGGDNGTQLTFWLDQKYQDGQHSIGRFRISVTTSPRPVPLESLPQNIATILATAVENRSDGQKTELLKYYSGLDQELQKRRQAVADSKKPRPADPRLVELRKLVEYANRPLPPDPKLEQLKQDVQRSAKDLENPRLTALQDLTWALINSPAFLFNR